MRRLKSWLSTMAYLRPTLLLVSSQVPATPGGGTSDDYARVVDEIIERLNYEPAQNCCGQRLRRRSGTDIGTSRVRGPHRDHQHSRQRDRVAELPLHQRSRPRG